VLEARQFFLEGIDLLFRLHQSLRKCPTASAFANELDEIRQPPFLGGQLCFLQADCLRNVAVERLDLCGHPLQYPVQLLRLSELCTDSIQDDLLRESAADQ
jgi:hypothetical protein